MVPIIELTGITKRFGPVEVLSEVDLALHGGLVHSLAGENGAGKSTLVKILAGIHQPDRGQILKDGVETTIAGTADARRQGIAVIHQHPALLPDLSVAENVFVGRQPKRSGLIDWATMQNRAGELLAGLGMGIDVETPVKQLSTAERQTVEIAKALSIDARVLVMDEPTSTISSREVDRLFEIVGRLKKQGVAILFISHFIDEILALCDEITVLRSGKRVATMPTGNLSAGEVVRLMIGTEPSSFFPKEEAQIGPNVLNVAQLSGAGFVENVSFHLRAGEILGFFGLVGAGRSELAHMLFGVVQAEGGTIQMDGLTIRPSSPHQAMATGISLVPEDRHQQGLVLPFSIRANATLPILQKLANKLGLVNRTREGQIAEEYAAKMRVRSAGIEQRTSNLSGGNQQKVLLAKWLIPKPKILILDEPTRGIDVGAKAEIHRIISQLAGQGMAIILISDDAPEVIGMADRILVFRSGHAVAEFERASFDREKMLLAAAHVPRAQHRAVPSLKAAEQEKASPNRRLGGNLKTVLRLRELGLVLALLVISAAITLREPRFLQPGNLEQVALSATLVCIVALGEALVIVARQIDLSVGAIVATSAFISAGWLEGHPGTPPSLVLLIGCAVGSGLGLFNALLVAVLRIPSIVATLATLAVYRGGIIVLAGGRQISATVLPESYGRIAEARFAGIPVIVLLACVLTVCLGFMARYTRLGRNLYALGSNPESARLGGISERWHIAFVFILTGLLCGLVGVLWGARFGTVDATIAPDLHLQAISAVVVGGVSIFGGSGSVYGAAVGAVIFAVLLNGVQLLGLNQFWIQAVLGAAILVTVLFYRFLTLRTERGSRRRSLTGANPS